MNTGNFGQAIEELKAGRKVWREGWNGNGIWLVLVNGWDMPESEQRSEIDEFETVPWIGMKTADNKFVPWLASQTDVLAEDWCSDRVY